MPSNRDALRKLTRQFPPPDELRQTLKNLRNNDDVPTALITASILDGLLEKIIEKHFCVDDQNLNGRIFLNRGPLSDFDSKIILCEALGFIDSLISKELNMIKNIRNAFAHTRSHITFQHDLISKEMQTEMVVGIEKYAKMSNVEITPEHNKLTFVLWAGIMVHKLNDLLAH